LDESQRITSFRNHGLEFEVIDSGPIDGEVVLLLHGWPQTARSWEAVSQRLNAAGYRTLAPNQRGYSPGARPHGRLAYRMSNLVSDIKALIEQIGRPVYLVGHDWGAAVAWSFSAKYPELVRTLTSVSVPHPGAFMRAMRTREQLRRSYYMAVFQVPKLPEFMVTRFRGAFAQLLTRSGMNKEQVEDVYKDIVDTGALTSTLNWYRAMFFSSPFDLNRKVRVPVMHIWSDRDNALSRRSAELAEQFVTGPYRLVVLTGDTHWVPEQAPDKLAELIRETMEMAR
jgi:pimeloyl-ACP methyl ester carboxylesterase